MKGRRMRTAERTLGELLELLLKVLPTKKLAGFEFVQAPETRLLLLLTAISGERVA